MGWKQQMEDSLDRYLIGTHKRWNERIDAANERIDAAEDRAAEAAEDEESHADDPYRPDLLFTPLWNRIFKAQAAEAAWIRMERCWETVGPGSPPEDAMFLALTLVGGERFTAVYFSTDGEHRFDHEESYLVIAPQATIGMAKGGYRVDFLLTLSMEPCFEVEYEAGINAQLRDGRIAKQLVVECDGHDFHDRTRAQASRDRERDRALQRRGLPVARFTGSDIWRDPYRCADDALDLLETRVMSAGDY